MCAGSHPSPPFRSPPAPDFTWHPSYLGCSLSGSGSACHGIAWRPVQPASGAQCIGQDLGEEACMYLGLYVEIDRRIRAVLC